MLLISPGILKWTDMDFGLPHLVSMGGYLQKHTGVRVELLDLNYEGGDSQRLLQTLDELGPFLTVGLSCYSSFDYMRVMALARFVRERYPDVPLVTGGYHASAIPDDVVFDGSPFDAVVVGEGERPMLEIIKTLLAGEKLDKTIYGPDRIEDLDELPPYQWDLLNRYWPRAEDIGRKLQIYLARGCPYHCTFCMERAKSGYKWRAYSAERAVDELRRLAARTDLSKWVVNLADPLFGFQRRWRREVLSGIIEHNLLPRQYWTLTRSDDLDEEDVELLARARVSIGIGLESGSPDMLTLMRKGNRPDAYLGALERLAKLSRKHGLTWASNIIVGHPGETMESMQQTRDYLTRVFTSAKETCGWLSIDPFRLYPGAQVHEAMGSYAAAHGTRFYHPTWWKTWYDGPFRAEHLDPSASVDFETRVNFMYEAYAPMVGEILAKFRGQGRSIDRVFARSIDEQARMMSSEQRDMLLARGRRAKAIVSKQNGADPHTTVLRFPIGLHLKDSWIRKREETVRRLLEDGVLRTDDLIETLLQVGPERYMAQDDALRMLAGESPRVEAEGVIPKALSMRLLAMGLEALEPAPNDRLADLTARTGYVAAVLAQLVGDGGSVLAMHPLGYDTQAFLRSLHDHENVSVLQVPAGRLLHIEGTFEGLWIGATLPRFPAHLREHMRDPEGRAIVPLGPRFGRQDMVVLTRHGDRVDERRFARVRVPVYAGAGGWLPDHSSAGLAEAAP